MKDVRLYLVHIIECVDKIELFTKDGKEIFLSNILIQDAVYRNFEIIGEAAKHVPDNVRKNIPDIPWRQVAGFRDVLIHQYDGVDPLQVWQVIENNLLDIRKNIQNYMDSLSI